MASATPPPDIEIVKAWISFAATVGAAAIAALIGGVGALIVTRRYQRHRDNQDKESEWRSHAIDLTKLDADRIMKKSKNYPNKPVFPFILTFLANYRDLNELNESNPADLYRKIRASRISGTPTQPTSRILDGFNTAICSGDPKSLHPEIFIALVTNKIVRCPYCNREFYRP